VDPRVDSFVSRLIELAAPGARPPWRLDPTVDGLLELTRPTKVQAEILRHRSGGAKLLVVLFAADVPDLSERDGFTLERSGGHARWTRPDEYVLAAPEPDGRVCEWHCEVPALDPAAAHRAVAAIPLLEPFEVLARPGAFVRSVGVERTADGGLRALVGVNRDLARVAEDEAQLVERGFREVGEDEPWADGDGRSVVWMGGTVYGYYGAVPERVGAL
jgi:hypothetical protein